MGSTVPPSTSPSRMVRPRPSPGPRFSRSLLHHDHRGPLDLREAPPDLRPRLCLRLRGPARQLAGLHPGLVRSAPRALDADLRLSPELWERFQLFGAMEFYEPGEAALRLATFGTLVLLLCARAVQRRQFVLTELSGSSPRAARSRRAEARDAPSGAETPDGPRAPSAGPSVPPQVDRPCTCDPPQGLRRQCGWHTACFLRETGGIPVHP